MPKGTPKSKKQVETAICSVINTSMKHQVEKRKAKLAKNKSALDAQIDESKSQWSPSSNSTSRFRMSTMDNRERMMNKELLEKAEKILVQA